MASRRWRTSVSCLAGYHWILANGHVAVNGYSYKMQALLVWKKMRMGQIKARRWNEEQKAKALEDGGAEETEESNADMMMVD